MWVFAGRVAPLGTLRLLALAPLAVAHGGRWGSDEERRLPEVSAEGF
jgi:hypothetical protein